MSAHTWLIVALVIYFGAMIAIGVYAAVKTKDHEDYMLGGRNLPPAVAALSAGASDMSGWLVMGLPGAIYAAGLIEAWIAIGLTIGAYLNWRFVAPRLRAYTEVARNSITIPSFFENRLRDRSRLLRIVSAVVILVFFTLYVSSGMVAGGVFFESAFGGDYLVGMLLVGGVTLAYTLFGGFLGASFTDFVQGIMILAAVLIVPVAAVVALGGFGEVGAAVDPAHLSLVGGEAVTGATIIAIVSSLAWGLGYFGQPHIIVRFMALRSAEEAKTARRIGMGWMILSLVGAVASGFVGIAFFAGAGLDNPETVILEMAQVLMHPLVAGLVLSAVLAAIMSTISSQLIVCSSALVEDVFRVVGKREPGQRLLALLGRGCVLIVAVIAILLALDPESTILELVGFAWAGFGAAFGPIILLSLFWRRLTAVGALSGMIVGAATVFLWPLLGTGLYEIVPGFALNLLVAFVVSRMTYRRDEEVDEEFTRTGTIVTKGVREG
ncbi:sodium/proline symporter PutP [Microbacterium sp. JZ31]|uniref:sodium/proline symporter PutP n=1 Tax=Microbacterium sp. JZ31 TaxID=1906274 RepID=UPI001931D585|nr:sodium/proline symporter PutP [Microbacterium sp. JZ31]